MSEQTTQLTIESSTNETMPSSQAFWRDQQLSRNSHPDFQFTMYRFNRENSSNWLVSDSEWMPLTAQEIDLQVADNPFGDALLLTAQLMVTRVDQRLWESLAEYLLRGANGFRVQLAQALNELDEIVDEAESEGYEIPNSTAIDNAEYITKRIYDKLSHPFQIYPMPDGEVAIDVTDEDGSSVLILCRPDGGTLCFVNINGNQRRAHYSNSDALPDGFMCEALEELQQE